MAFKQGGGYHYGVNVVLNTLIVVYLGLRRRHHCRWRAANFDLCSAIIAIEQREFFSVQHLLLHGASVYNGHLWGPVILTPIAERLAVELSLPVFTTKVCRGWDSNTQAIACGTKAQTHWITAAVKIHVIGKNKLCLQMLA